MVDSPYSLTSNDINVLSEEGWGPVDVGSFQRDALAAQYPAPIVSADIYQLDSIPQGHSMPRVFNQITTATSTDLDWSHTIQHEMCGASVELHYTSEPPATASFDTQSTLGATDTSLPNIWRPQFFRSNDVNSEVESDTRRRLRSPESSPR